MNLKNRSMHFLIFLTSFLIVTHIYFDNEYVRKVTFDYNRTDADNFKNFQGWPWKMKVRLRNYVCTIPSHRNDSDFSDEELAEAWDLPPGTRLSLEMQLMAGCELYVERTFKSKGVFYDSDECHCMGFWPSLLLDRLGFWPAWIFGLGLFSGCISLGYLLIDNRDYRSTKIDWSMVSIAVISYFLWASAFYFAIMKYAQKIIMSIIMPNDDLFSLDQYYNGRINWIFVIVAMGIILLANNEQFQPHLNNIRVKLKTKWQPKDEGHIEAPL